MFYYSRRYPEGYTFFEEGETGHLAYIVKSGRVKVTKKHGDQELAIAVFGQGEIFGEMALLGTQRRTATARAIEEAEVIPISRAHLLSLLQRADPILKRLVLSFVERLRRTTEFVNSDLVEQSTKPQDASQPQSTIDESDLNIEDI